MKGMRFLSIALFAMAVCTFTASTSAAAAKTLTVQNLQTFSSNCGHIVQSKDNGSDRLVVVIGEFHTFGDVQENVDCLIGELLSTYKGIKFFGYEGGSYWNGQVRSNLRVTGRKDKIPVIGIEGEAYRREYSRRREIDGRHAELSKKKMEVGLTELEHVEYKHISFLSYEIILRKRSWDWIDNLKDFMDKNRLNIGLINTGFTHFPTMAERFDHHNISYVFFLPNAAHNYCTCEAYWQKKKPGKTSSCKVVCENPAINAFWD